MAIAKNQIHNISTSPSAFEQPMHSVASRWNISATNHPDINTN